MKLPAAREVGVLPGVAVLEDNGVVEDEVRIVKEVDDGRGGCHSQQPGRLTPLSVEVLPPGIQGSREEAARLPFEGLLAPPLVPDGGGTPSREHIDELLEEILLRLEAGSGAYLHHVGIVGTPCPLQVDVGTESPPSIPGRQLHLF